jgi:hypothetical protein
MLLSATTADGSGVLMRFSNTGGTPETLFTYASAGLHPLALDAAGALYTSDGTDLIALDVSGSAASPLWKIPTTATGAFTSLVVGNHGEIDVVSKRGEVGFGAGQDLFVFAPDRTLVWSYPTLDTTSFDIFAGEMSLIYVLSSGLRGGPLFGALDNGMPAWNGPAEFLGRLVDSAGLVYGVLGTVEGPGDTSWEITASSGHGPAAWEFPLAKNATAPWGNELPHEMVITKDGALGVLTSERVFRLERNQVAWQVERPLPNALQGRSLFVDREGTFVTIDGSTVAGFAKDGHSVFSVTKSGLIQVLPGGDGMIYAFTSTELLGIGD